MTTPLISIVTPCFNEEAGIQRCIESVKSCLESFAPIIDYEHIVIDNCSTDNTLKILESIVKEYPRLRVIASAQNVGAEKSFIHALMQCNGDAAIPILADLQTPVSTVPLLIDHWIEGSRIVVAVKSDVKPSSALDRIRTMFYSILFVATRGSSLRNFIGFGIFDRDVIEIIRLRDDKNPFFRMLVLDLGVPYKTITYVQPDRVDGRSSHSKFDLVQQAIRGLVTYSNVIIFQIIIFGFVMAFISLVMAVVYLFLKLRNWSDFEAGTAPTLIAALLLGAVQLISIGVVGLYADVTLRNVRSPNRVRELKRINWFNEAD